MPSLPWTRGTASSDGTATILASRLELRSRRDTIRFFRAVQEIRRQLRDAKGLIGYSLRARPLSGRYFTLSAWESPEALDAFVQTEPHARNMREIGPMLGDTGFRSWELPASELPPSWTDAQQRLGVA